ncbi:MAG: acetyl-CoA C-acyltransferase FadI [Myxococcales bacterium]|nr:MAG: acetyl-CoA C-acyltransferase FadI [Myxococcales bacterium]
MLLERRPAGERVAIVAGLRTPFQKQGTGLRSMTTVDLATAVVTELMARSGVDPREITLCVYGQVVPTLDWLNIAREVVLRAGLPRDIEAYSVSRACATSIQAMTSGAEAILAGQHDVALVGGADSMSDVPLGVSRALRDALLAAQKGRTMAEKLGALRGLKPRDLVPPVPGFSREPTTGEQMGEAAEKMAKENHISRAWQDDIALASHHNAARAWADGTYAAEVMTVVAPPYREAVAIDNIVRSETSAEALAKLKPAFDRQHGTITAGNSSPLTDGASALILMRESKAKALGHRPLGYLTSWSYAAVDPSWQLLMGPVLAAPVALDRAGLTLKDMALVDMHEAFAAQVASNIQALESAQFGREKLGRSGAVGEINRATLNVNGGSIAIGHPFAATGGRMVLSTLRELNKRGGQHALLTLCAAGGLGAAVVLESGEA